MKGLLIAGGKGTRLSPSTIAVNKHLLPVFDKPLIFYSLTTLMLSGIRNIQLIVRRVDFHAFRELLGDGSEFGVTLSYGFQDNPKGIADTIRVSRDFIGSEEFALALGDNVFFGSGLSGTLSSLKSRKGSARILLKEVNDPERYGIAWVNSENSVIRIEEKPKSTSSNLAITGLYFFPENTLEVVDNVDLSPRGELEITDVLSKFLDTNQLDSWVLPRGTMWLDTGTIESLMDASNFVRSFQALSGQLIGSPHEVAWRNKGIDDLEIRRSANGIGNAYGKSLLSLVDRQSTE